MDFDAIADYWFGEDPTPEFPLNAIDPGTKLPQERLELVDPFEESKENANTERKD